MSEHKTGVSNWTDKQRADYWDRRTHGVRGQAGAVTVHRIVKNEKGSEQRLPLGKGTGSTFSRGKQPSNAHANRGPAQAHVQQQRKASTRGE